MSEANEVGKEGSGGLGRPLTRNDVFRDAIKWEFTALPITAVPRDCWREVIICDFKSGVVPSINHVSASIKPDRVTNQGGTGNGTIR